MRSTTYWFYTYHAENRIHLLGRLKAEFAVEFQFTKTCLQIDLAHLRWRVFACGWRPRMVLTRDDLTCIHSAIWDLNACPWEIHMPENEQPVRVRNISINLFRL